MFHVLCPIWTLSNASHATKRMYIKITLRVSLRIRVDRRKRECYYLCKIQPTQMQQYLNLIPQLVKMWSLTV